ncbi:S9 family peptidase [Roseateles oligotrophus]|uniref:Prolyl oligopeptidase family serine peptidase n=1 Tax=Roseateles oligotrophus TaxID=1769250 RepID=A0ABT2YDC7_9BURK|nr:prolyl oligopeptidase family serine peptidase [Roseateles oligotrophus]MCV2368034.1 prolyl oligopeptidase family serine peptidase [Roseateles oligotrophus]
MRPTLCSFAWLVLLACVSLPAVQAKPAVPPASLVADGIPSFEWVGSSERKAPNAVRFVDWHPMRPEMLVLATAGGSMQLHSLAKPGAKPRPLTAGRDKVETARWEPSQGEYLVFSRDHGGDEAYRLFRLQAQQEGAAMAEAQALTPVDGRVSEFTFLPKGSGLVYVLDRLDRQAEAGQQGGSRQSRSRLMWVDPLKPDSARQLGETLGGRYTDLRVAPSGAVVLTHTLAGKSQTLVFGLNGEAGRPLGNAVAAADAEFEDEELLWGRRVLQGDFRQLVSLGLASGHRSAQLPELKADLEALGVPPAGSDRPFALIHNEDGVSVLRLYTPTAGAPIRIGESLPAGLVQNPRWHHRLPLLAFDHISAQSPGRVQVYDLSNGELRAWTGADATLQAGEAGDRIDYGSLRWTSFDGLTISGLHIAPPARFKGPRPVYISIHGGPSSQSRPGYLNATLRHLVEVMGMHVILPNVRGSDGFGKKFLSLDNGRRREDSVKDISALLDVVASRADMDAARVVVAGGSYGGYMSLAVAVRESKRIAGNICRVGIANFASFLENTESYRRDNRRGEYGDERDPKMREFLQQISPLNHAAKVKKPLFIVHGRNDPRVPYAEAQQMVAAVRAGGTPVWFLTAEDEGHSFTNVDNRDYLFQATVEFVSRLIGAKAEAVDERSAKPAPPSEGELAGATTQSL